MNYYEVLRSKAEPVAVEPGSTSYFSVPAAGLDPRLFQNAKILPGVRDSILGTLFGYLNTKFQGADVWSEVWLAGSGVSYQWDAQRTPSDLDCLIGVDFAKFRELNTNYAGFSNAEIAAMFNEEFREELHPKTEDFLGAFELTFYVNVQSNIRLIKAYAAYSLTTNSWTVPPAKDIVRLDPEWQKATSADVVKAQQIIDKYGSALEKVKTAQNEVLRINAERELALAAGQGADLFDIIHSGRGEAFSESGAGYGDFANYRWQAGKQSGIIQALKKLKNLSKESRSAFAAETYGIELPDASTLIRRAGAYATNRTF